MPYPRPSPPPPDQLIDFRAELNAAVDAAFLAQNAMSTSRRRHHRRGSDYDYDHDGDDDNLGYAGQQRRHRRLGSSSFSGGGGIASPLGGIPEAEWKLRALEEEVQRMEAELREERASRMQLELMTQENNASVSDGSREQRLLHLNVGVLGSVPAVDELRSVIVSAASRTGLPVSLRIQVSCINASKCRCRRYRQCDSKALFSRLEENRPGQLLQGLLMIKLSFSILHRLWLKVWRCSTRTSKRRR